MAKVVTSSQSGSGTTWGEYTSVGNAEAGIAVAVTFIPDPVNRKSDQNK